MQQGNDRSQTFSALHDDFKLVEEATRFIEMAEELGVTGFCKRLKEAGLNEQQLWLFVRRCFADVAYGEFQSAYYSSHDCD